MGIFTNIPMPESGNFYDQYLSRRKSQNELKKLEAEAEYAPYTQYANALSKSTYGKYAPATALATFMNSPAINNLSKEQVEGLTSQMQNYLKQAGSSNAIPEPRGRGGFIDNVFGQLINKISPYSQNSMNQPVQQPVQQMQQPAPMAQSVNNENIPVNNAPIIPPPQQFVPGGIMPAQQLFGTGSYGKQAAGAAIPGSVAGINPNSGAKATESGLIAGTTAEAQNEVKNMDQMINSDNVMAKSVPDIKFNLDKAKDARSRLEGLQKGGLFGHSPALTTAANDYDGAMASIATQWAKADAQGSLTNMGREMAIQAKSPRTVTDESFNHMYEYNSGLQNRILEKPLFNTTLQKLGYNSSQIPILWNYYQTKRPFYDNKTHKKDDDNINSWEEFYQNPKNVQAAFSPKAQKEIDKFVKPKVGNTSTGESSSNPSNHTTQYVKLGDTTYHYQNGVYYQ